MGAMCGLVLPYPLTAMRDFVERELHAALPEAPPAAQLGHCGRTRPPLHSTVCPGRLWAEALWDFCLYFNETVMLRC